VWLDEECMQYLAGYSEPRLLADTQWLFSNPLQLLYGIMYTVEIGGMDAL
jgi:hypothetical protein